MSTTSVSPAERLSTQVDGVEVLGALSPSRAGDFLACPLLYRFRTIDRLPEPPSVDAVRGTVVHKVLEDLFDLPAGDRTVTRAHELLAPAWAGLQAAEPDVADLFGDADELGRWLGTCRDVIERYFTLEDPTRLEPADRELYVEAVLDSKLLVRGFIDRVDVAPTGEIRIVDYKGLAVDTPLPTPTGWTTMADVEVGDQLIGWDGCPTTVTVKSAIHQRPCYRLTFADGSSVVADNVHQWTVVSSNRQKRTTRTVSTEELVELHRTNITDRRPHCLWVATAEPLDLPEADLAIEPWLLGAWLGDGDSRAGTLTVGRADVDDMTTLIKQHWSREVLVREERTAWRVTPGRRQDVCMYGHADFVMRPDGRQRRCAREWEHPRMTAWNVGLTALLREQGLLHNKHVPAAYLRASRAQRLDVLRGLMDTDGWWSNSRKRAGFTTTDDRLAADVVELLRTLGIHPQHFRKPYENASRPGRTCHIIEFTPTGIQPFSLPRKAALCEGVSSLRADLARRRIITSIESVPSVPTQCISVDAADSLYLCGTGFIPTHNTGRAPGEMFEAKALFQLKIYALVLWRTRGVVPTMLQLIYLGNGEILRYEPDEADLRATERKLDAIWRAIRIAQDSGDWRPRRSRLCGWCAHQSLCPEFGGTPPPLPALAPLSPSLVAETGP